MSVTVRAPAKVNLYLGVGPARPDGFHEVVTVYQALSLVDEVTVEPADALSVAVVGETAGVPTDATNLAARAVQTLAPRVGVHSAVRVTIRKGIPAAAGLAGGSADAAAALVACDTLWGTGLGREELAEVAASLGSDVPFALTGGTALGTGRGERLTPVLSRGGYSWVLAIASEGLATPAVYARHDALRGDRPAPEPAAPRALLAALRAGDAVALGRALANDLQPAALSLRPDLRRVLHAADELGVLGAIVSGSGPTVALLARSDTHAVHVTAALAGAGVCRTARRAHGPAPGAHVIVPAQT